jgi:cell wall integrity and stress response component
MKIRKRRANGLGRPGSLLAAVAVVSQFSGALGLTLSYCSSLNTGSDTTPGTGAELFMHNTDRSLDVTIYQSLGACQNKCGSTYAFAVVQGEDCWCSNYAPATTVDISKCDTSCPGYPFEQCGSTGNNLFGYLALNGAPSGTLDAQVRVLHNSTSFFLHLSLLHPKSHPFLCKNSA